MILVHFIILLINSISLSDLSSMNQLLFHIPFSVILNHSFFFLFFLILNPYLCLMILFLLPIVWSSSSSFLSLLLLLITVFSIWMQIPLLYEVEYWLDLVVILLVIYFMNYYWIINLEFDAYFVFIMQSFILLLHL